MAELATLARPYANAVFDIAKNENRLAEWSRMLSFLSVAAQTPAVESLIQSPGTTRAQKAHGLAEVVGDELNDAGRRFVQVLASNGRLPLLEEIAEQYEVLRAEAERKLDVEITSAVALGDAELARLVDVLRARFEQEIDVTTSVDADLLGGAIIRAGDTVIDGSVRGKLRKLSETLQRT